MDNFRTPEQMFVSEMCQAAVRSTGTVPDAPTLRGWITDFVGEWRSMWPPQETVREFEALHEAPTPSHDTGGARGLPPTPPPERPVVPLRPAGLPEPSPIAEIDKNDNWAYETIGMGKDKDCRSLGKKWAQVTWAEVMGFLKRGKNDFDIGYIEWLAGLKGNPPFNPKNQFGHKTKGRALETIDRIGRATPAEV